MKRLFSFLLFFHVCVLGAMAQTADEYFDRAVASHNGGIYEEAIKDYNKAIELKPDFASAYCNRGICKKNLGMYAEAVKDFDKSIELKDSGVYMNYNNRGYAYFNLQNYAKAVEDWEEMRKIAPEDYTPQYNYIDEARAKLADNNTIAELQRKLEEEKKKNENNSMFLPSTHPKRLALVIGNNNYLYKNSLSNAKNDAMDMQQKLQELGFEVLYYENLGFTQLKNAIDDFGAKLQFYEAGLVFFAGHGSQYNNKNYLIPTDAKLQYETLLEDEAINADRIVRNMEGAGAKINIVILDACRDNPFARSWKSTGRGENKGGLAKIEAENSQGLFVMFATSPDAISLDFAPCGGNSRNGLFTGNLLPNLQKGVRIEDVFKRTKKAVRECSENGQIPWNHNSLEGDFIF